MTGEVGMQVRKPKSATPRFTIVSAAYNVQRYLAAFIESVESQTFPLEQLEVIVVDDGSTDDTLAILETWHQRRPGMVRLFSQPNGGAGAARNLGLEHATGEWVTFPDPDDILDSGYLAEVDAFLRKKPETMMVATSRLVFNDLTGKQSKHALHSHFRSGANRLRNLNYDTGHFHGHAAGTFFRTEEIHRTSLRFEERLRVSFEDGHFCCDYLLRAPEPLVAFLPSALYNYRKRDDGTSLMDRRWSDPGIFTDLLEHGYLALLREGADRYGRAPSWLQGMVLYELSWFFKMNDKVSAPTAGHGATAVRFHELLEQICELFDDAGVEAYGATEFPAVWRETLQRGYRDENWHTPYAVVDKVDVEQRMMRVIYRFTGTPPEELFSVYSKLVEPVHAKIRDVPLFGRTMLHERIVWLPFGTLRLVLNGQELDMRTSDPLPPTHRLTPPMIRKGLELEQPKADKGARAVLTAAERMVLRLANTRLVKRYFGGAWVLIDRNFNADDSAEHLFRYLRTHRRDINAWFVIERGTPDYRRLRRDGYRRVVPQGSLAWKLLMLNCKHLVSSHIDDVIVRPKVLRGFAPHQWRITFLQHGIIKDDLSTWLNRKNIDVFVTSTRAECQSIVSDHTTYGYTTREVKLTGLPRFDRVLEEGNKYPPDRRDLIVVAPTWRHWLSSADSTFTGRHTVDAEDLRGSQFAREWTTVLNSPELKDLAERHGLTVALLLHPNFQATAKLDTPPHVRTLQFEGQNVQEIFARARVLITDYSSMFFNAAYIERPVVYFQFDRERVLGGWHLGRRGYFDYERDGFGPVTLTSADAIAAITDTVDRGAEPDPLYLERIRSSFPERDGRCCERVTDAIIRSTRPAGRGPVRQRPGVSAVEAPVPGAEDVSPGVRRSS